MVGLSLFGGLYSMYDTRMKEAWCDEPSGKDRPLTAEILLDLGNSLERP